VAWNVVIAGGGFAGASAARCLERKMPTQSTRLVLVNDVNFILYTPFLPEAAAGTLEPRHVVTPLREILNRTYLRLGAVTGHDPGARTVELTTHEGETEELRGCCRSPASRRTRSASRASRTRSGCETT
jgi:NADH:ubiquinone reductase (H+-translocating)